MDKLVIEINKDIEKYKESVALGLTARQMIYSIIALLVGGSIVLLLYPYIGLTGSAYVAIPVVAPIALTGFYSYNGMTFMEVMRLKLHFLFNNRALPYISTEGEDVISKLRMEDELAEKKSKKQEKWKKNTKQKSMTDNEGVKSMKTGKKKTSGGKQNKTKKVRDE